MGRICFKMFSDSDVEFVTCKSSAPVHAQALNMGMDGGDDQGAQGDDHQGLQRRQDPVQHRACVGPDRHELDPGEVVRVVRVNQGGVIDGDAVDPEAEPSEVGLEVGDVQLRGVGGHVPGAPGVGAAQEVASHHVPRPPGVVPAARGGDGRHGPLAYPHLKYQNRGYNQLSILVLTPPSAGDSLS